MRTCPPRLVLAAVLLCVVVPFAASTSAQSVGTARGVRARPPVTASLPLVSRVEPPNWWANHSVNPVRLLVHGTNLHGARLESASPGVHVGALRVNAAGTYVIVDVTIDPEVAAGPASLQLVTSAGRAAVPFEISAPLARAGRFQGFDSDDVVYLLMPDRFANGSLLNDNPAASPGLLDRTRRRRYHGGDLQGVIDRLPYLKDLGITAVWLNPWYDNDNRLNTRERYDNDDITDYHGYGPTDFYAVEERFGDMATLTTLVEKAHALGIKVIQDQVANHTGPFHAWVKDPPTPTWFNGTEARHLSNGFQTFRLIDPNAPRAFTQPTLDGWFINILPDLNQHDADQRQYWIQNSLWWIGMTGLDAVRQDTVPYVPRDFWRDWIGALKREYPNIRVVGEVLEGSAPMVSFYQGGRTQWDGIDAGFDSLFDYPLHYGIRAAFAQGRPLRDLVNVLHLDALYPRPQQLVTLLGSHDVPRFLSEPGATIDGLMLGATFLFTVRGIPLWYYGDEVAMTGGGDPDNRRDFPGGWPDDARSAFEPAGRTPDEARMHAHVRTLAHLRASLEPLRRGTHVHLAVGNQTYAFARVCKAGTVVVAINNDTSPQVMQIPLAGLSLDDGVVFDDRLGAIGRVTVRHGMIEVTLPARTGAVFARPPA